MQGQIPRDIKKVRAAAVRAIIAYKKALFIEELKQANDLAVVLDGDGSHKGVTQYYVDCVVQSIPQGHDPRSLLHVRPVRPILSQEAELHGEESPSKNTFLVEPMA